MTDWPELYDARWSQTRETLHLFTQIVGKITLAYTPLMNHWWNAGLRLNERGLESELIHHNSLSYQFIFDFNEHLLGIKVSDGRERGISLEDISVAEFYHAVVRDLKELDFQAHIWDQPVEIASAVPFSQDEEHVQYDADAVTTFWQVLNRIDAVYEQFRAQFVGKQSPNIFWWGSFDFATSRFSGKTAPPNTHKAPYCGPQVMVEAYSHEIFNVGYWPNFGEQGAFFCYFYPDPEGFHEASVQPEAAYWDTDLGEFILPYDTIQGADDPGAELLKFMTSCYKAGSELAGWDNSALLRQL